MFMYLINLFGSSKSWYLIAWTVFKRAVIMRLCRGQLGFNPKSHVMSPMMKEGAVMHDLTDLFIR